MKKSIYKILAFCGLLCLTSCDYGTCMYINLNDQNNITYVVTAVEGNSLYNEHRNKVNCTAVNKDGYKLFIKANADNLSYGDTIIITKK